MKSKYRLPHQHWFASHGLNIMTDDEQQVYVDKMLAPVDECQAIFVDAKAGTGKTTLAIASALYLLELGKISRIVYLRSPIAVVDIGFLPGTLEEKQDAFMRPLVQTMGELGYMPETIYQMMEHNQLEMTTTAYLQGIDYSGEQFIIIDEAQNFDLIEMRMALTRIHDSAKVVIIGSNEQIMNSKVAKMKKTPFQIYTEHFAKNDEIKTAQLKLTTNYRGKFSQWADEIAHSWGS